MARPDELRGITPADPLNSYEPASFRGVIITGVLAIVVVALLWWGYSAALNNPDLQREMDGREQIQGDPFPAQPQPGN